MKKDNIKRYITGALAVLAVSVIVFAINRASPGSAARFASFLLGDIAQFPSPQAAHLGNSSSSPAARTFCNFNATSSRAAQQAVFKTIAWMGDKTNSANEWFSVEKIATDTLDISGFEVENRGGQIKIIVPPKTLLTEEKPAYIFARQYNIPGIAADLVYSGNMKNSADGLRLFDSGCHLMDEVLASPDWPAGNNATKDPMERNLATLAWYDTANPMPTKAKAAVAAPALPAAPQKININIATQSALETLKGIGPAKAAAIVDYRNKNGPFSRIEDITRVSGIGSSTFENIKNQITVSDTAP